MAFFVPRPPPCGDGGPLPPAPPRSLADAGEQGRLSALRRLGRQGGRVGPSPFSPFSPFPLSPLPADPHPAAAGREETAKRRGGALPLSRAGTAYQTGLSKR